MTVRDPDPEKVAKLPKWAQEHIKNLDRALEATERALQEYVDEQTPSPIEVSDVVCGSRTRSVKRYVQATSIKVTSAGVKATVSTDEKGISVMYEGKNRASGDVALIPRASNSIFLRKVTYTEK